MRFQLAACRRQVKHNNPGVIPVLPLRRQDAFHRTRRINRKGKENFAVSLRWLAAFKQPVFTEIVGSSRLKSCCKQRVSQQTILISIISRSPIKNLRASLLFSVRWRNVSQIQWKFVFQNHDRWKTNFDSDWKFLMVTMGLERSALGRNRASRRLAVPFFFRGDEIGFSKNRLISEGLRQFYERCLILFPIYIFPKHSPSHCTQFILFSTRLDSI